MRHKSLLLVALAALVGMAMGLAVGLVLGTSENAPSANASAAAVSAGPGAAHPVEPVQPTARTAERRRAEGGVSSTADAAAMPVLRGEGRITGRVHDHAGAPIAGVRVVAVPVRKAAKRGDEGRAGPPTLEEEQRDVAERHRWRETNSRECTTGEDGLYTLDGLADEAHEITAWRAGYTLRPSGRGEHGPEKPGGKRDFLAMAVVGVRVAVLLPDGTPAQEATVTWKQDEHDGWENDSVSWTAADPVVPLRSGGFAFTASAGPHGEFRSDTQNVVLAPGDAPPEVTLRCLPRAGIAGRVTYASKERPAGVRVLSLRVEPGTDADPTQLAVLRERGQTVEGDGKFALLDLAPGRYLVGAVVRGGIVIATATVEVAGNLVVQDLAVPALDVTDHVIVRVVGPDGAPLRDVRFTTGRNAGDNGSSGTTEAVTLPDGSYRVPHHDPTEANSSWSGGDEGAVRPEDVKWWVRADSRSLGAREARYRPGVDRELTIQYPAPAKLDLLVRGGESGNVAGRLAAGLEATASKDDDLQPEWMHQHDENTEELDASARCTLVAGEAGTYRLSLWSRTGDTHAYNSRILGRWPVTLAAGENSLEIDLPVLRDLVVTADEPAKLDDMSLRRWDDVLRRWEWAGECTRTGDRKVYPGLPAGRYRLESPDGEMQLALPVAGEVRFRPRPYNALRVTASGPESCAAKSGLQPDDLVVAIDGAEFEGLLQLEAAVAAAKTRDSARLTVLRGTQRLEVDAKMADLEDEYENAAR